MVALMRGHTVDVSPWEQTVVWAYPQLRFDSLPVITDYNAYTPSLDQLDASYLGSRDAPRFILRQAVAIDGRDPAFEPPATQLAIECSYRQVAVRVAGIADSWQLLERGPNRCGTPRPLGSVATGFDQWVAVPNAPAGDAVVARIQLAEGWFSAVESALFKPPEVFLQYAGDRPAWRFIASTGPDLHVLRPASSLDFESSFAPTALGRLRFSVQGGHRTSTGVTISFYLVHEDSDGGGFAGPTGDRS
jgi:hypothetical protein